MPPLVLASASSRRAELLRQVGWSFEIAAATPEEETLGVIPSGADHQGWTLDQVRARARRAALDKARPVSEARPDAVVIAADTVVTVDGIVLGKPTTAGEAVEMLHRLAGRTHHVVTGVVVAHGRRGVTLADDSTTAVQFRVLPPEEVLRYVASGEPMDKAGAYGIQGRAALFVEKLEGDYFGVVGLPLARLARMLETIGVRPA
ncbi:MAG: septum formation protein Maf [Armatimonadetes bacterium]|nr:septum formation protein Maf [Armatimonadota bacterium]